jgi:catechol 2,3-dioxygenase-like lactoylglutathione lyase family enzyme
MSATGFTHATVHAHDLDESARFYKELFGMENILTPDFTSFSVRWLRVGCSFTSSSAKRRRPQVPRLKDQGLQIEATSPSRCQEQSIQRGEWGRKVMKRTDVILSAGTLAVVLLVVVVVAATGATDEFAAWAWARHHNELSWYIRVLFVLPFCYFAYKRSLWGIVLTVVALSISMFWFPASERVDSRAAEFLAVEREYLTSGWSLWKVMLALLVPISFVALAVAFWKRSLVWGLAVINAMCWSRSYVVSTLGTSRAD